VVLKKFLQLFLQLALAPTFLTVEYLVQRIRLRPQLCTKRQPPVGL